MREPHGNANAANERSSRYRVYFIPILIVLGVSLMATAVFGLYVYRKVAVNSARTEAIQKELESEFRQIKNPPNTRVLRYSSTQKIGQAEVSCDYLSSSTYQELRRFYDSEL